jgi:hypothetical protein
LIRLTEWNLYDLYLCFASLEATCVLIVVIYSILKLLSWLVRAIAPV